MSQSTLPAPFTTCTLSRSTKNSNRGRSGVSRTPSRRHSRNWIPSRSSRPQQSWASSWRGVFHSRSSSWGRVGAAALFPQGIKLAEAALGAISYLTISGAVRRPLCDVGIQLLEGKHPRPGKVYYDVFSITCMCKTLVACGTAVPADTNEVVLPRHAQVVVIKSATLFARTNLGSSLEISKSGPRESRNENKRLHDLDY
jgi:hypothetical protein